MLLPPVRCLVSAAAKAAPFFRGDRLVAAKPAARDSAVHSKGES